MHAKFLATAALLLSQIAVPALATEAWDIDTHHSQAQFKIRHMMVSNVGGTISGVKGSANYDGKSLKNLSVNAELDPATINTSDSGRDNHLKQADFFDVSKFPTLTFKSEKVLKRNGKTLLIGDLTMHGVTKKVELTLDGPTPVIKDKKGVERVGASASTRINRLDFGVGGNSPLEGGGLAVGNDVDITLDIELTKKSEVTTKPANNGTGS